MDWADPWMNAMQGYSLHRRVNLARWRILPIPHGLSKRSNEVLLRIGDAGTITTVPNHASIPNAETSGVFEI